jgi:hypothetical protein
MREAALLLMSLLLVLPGCRHDSPEEIHQKQMDAASRGRDRFSEELVQKNVTWYVPAGSNFTGFDANTGLPEQLISSTGLVDPFNSEFIRGHNDAILQYISVNGPVPGSFKPWVAQLYHQPAYFDLHKDESPQKLSAGAPPVKSPDGQYTLVIVPSGGSGNLITRTPYELSVLTASGQHSAPPPAGVSEPSAEVLFGPNGSDLAFTRWPGAGQPIYAALNLRTGQWLVVQSGQP